MSFMGPKILAIESSCDETSASVLVDGKVLNNVIATQRVHEIYGGVVPELASRAHHQKIVFVVDQALNEANLKVSDLDAVAYTKGPGLLGALLVGASFAKGLALANNLPLIGVHHMKAHILAHFIDEPFPGFPFLCLTVSGGHTQIVQVNSAVDMQVLGQTRDDAVGEAFDKCAKMLGFPYPGGPLIDKYSKNGNPEKFSFSKSSMPDLDFSFSGIKTGFLYFLNDQKKINPQFIEENKADLCASLQEHLIDMLLDKVEKAVKKTGIRAVGIAGGVSANSRLRERLEKKKNQNEWEVFIPDFQYCTDNAGMIAMAAHFLYQENQFETIDSVPDPRLTF